MSARSAHTFMPYSLWFIVLAVLCICVEQNRCACVVGAWLFKVDFCCSSLKKKMLGVMTPQIHHSSGENHAPFSPCHKSEYFSIKRRVCMCVRPILVDAPTNERSRMHHTHMHIDRISGFMVVNAVKFLVFFLHSSQCFLHLSSYL